MITGLFKLACLTGFVILGLAFFRRWHKSDHPTWSEIRSKYHHHTSPSTPKTDTPDTPDEADAPEKTADAPSLEKDEKVEKDEKEEPASTTDDEPEINDTK